MSTIKTRLMEIAHDLEQQDPVPNRYFEKLLGLSSGRITQLFEAGSIAKLGARSIGRLTRLGYSADWVQDGKLPKITIVSSGERSSKSRPPNQHEIVAFSDDERILLDGFRFADPVTQRHLLNMAKESMKLFEKRSGKQ